MRSQRPQLTLLAAMLTAAIALPLATPGDRLLKICSRLAGLS
jgi:hypothetical protein